MELRDLFTEYYKIKGKQVSDYIERRCDEELETILGSNRLAFVVGLPGTGRHSLCIHHFRKHKEYVEGYFWRKDDFDENDLKENITGLSDIKNNMFIIINWPSISDEGIRIVREATEKNDLLTVVICTMRHVSGPNVFFTDVYDSDFEGISWIDKIAGPIFDAGNVDLWHSFIAEYGYNAFVTSLMKKVSNFKGKGENELKKILCSYKSSHVYMGSNQYKITSWRRTEPVKTGFQQGVALLMEEFDAICKIDELVRICLLFGTPAPFVKDVDDVGLIQKFLSVGVLTFCNGLSLYVVNPLIVRLTWFSIIADRNLKHCISDADFSDIANDCMDRIMKKRYKNSDYTYGKLHDSFENLVNLVMEFFTVVPKSDSEKNKFANMWSNDLITISSYFLAWNDLGMQQSVSQLLYASKTLHGNSIKLSHLTEYESNIKAYYDLMPNVVQKFTTHISLPFPENVNGNSNKDPIEYFCNVIRKNGKKGKKDELLNELLCRLSGGLIISDLFRLNELTLIEYGFNDNSEWYSEFRKKIEICTTLKMNYFSEEMRFIKYADNLLWLSKNHKLSLTMIQFDTVPSDCDADLQLCYLCESVLVYMLFAHKNNIDIGSDKQKLLEKINILKHDQMFCTPRTVRLISLLLGVCDECKVFERL